MRVMEMVLHPRICAGLGVPWEPSDAVVEFVSLTWLRRLSGSELGV